MLPYYDFYWKDYSAKTAHLTMGQHGAYMQFLKFIYTQGRSIPDKGKYDIARAVNKKEKADAQQVLEEFFQKEGAFWRSKKATEIIAECQQRYDNRVKAGKEGGEKKASNARAKLEQCQGDDSATLGQSSTNLEPRTKKKDIITSYSLPDKPQEDLNFSNGGFGGKPWDVRNYLSEKVKLECQEVVRLFGFDYDKLIDKYNCDYIGKIQNNEPPRNPDIAFPEWLKTYLNATQGKRKKKYGG